MSQVVTFGEIMLRLTTPGYQRFSQASHFEISFGGAEANVAVTIAQLGGSAEFVTRLPENEIAERAICELRAAGVGVRHIARGGERLGVYFLEQGASQRAPKVVYDRRHSATAQMESGHFDWPAIFAGARWFHWSGITPALSASATTVVAEACQSARQHGLTVSFDINFRAKLWSYAQAGAALRPLMKYVDLCVCAAEDAQKVLGVEGGSDVAVAAELREKFGIKSVALTRRESESASETTWGGSLFTPTGQYNAPAHKVAVVDRVGAGDTFTGALIFALSRGDDPQRAIRFALAAGTLKHTVAGDFARFSLREVEDLLSGGHGGRVQR